MSLNQFGSRGADSTGTRQATVSALASLMVLGALAVGCAGSPKPQKSCAVFHASNNLNLYDGEPHPITVYVYPLSSPLGFSQTSSDDLLGGAMPDGVLAPPVPITISPREEHSFVEVFPDRTHHLGLLADYYRAPGDPQGTLTQVVPARCGLRKPKLVLSPKDIYLK